MRQQISNELKMVYNLSIKENWQVERFHYKDKNGGIQQLQYLGLKINKDPKKCVIWKNYTIYGSGMNYKRNIRKDSLIN